MEFKEISVMQVNRILVSIQEKYNLQKPTYTVELAGGGKQTFEYDEDSIKDAPQQDAEKWNEYQEQYKLMQNEINEKSTAYIFYNGIDCEIEQEWLDMQKWLEIELPENSFDLKVMYITHHLLKTPKDIREAIAKIMKISLKGTDESAVKAAESMFSGTSQAG